MCREIIEYDGGRIWLDTALRVAIALRAASCA